MISTDVVEEGKLKGWHRSTIYRAANRLGVIKAGGGFATPQTWRLP